MTIRIGLMMARLLVLAAMAVAAYFLEG